MVTCGFRAGFQNTDAESEAGSALGSPIGQGGSRTGQRDKLNCDVVTSEASACPESGGGMALQRCTKLRQEAELFHAGSH